jgi:hypothetical protein
MAECREIAANVRVISGASGQLPQLVWPHLLCAVRMRTFAGFYFDASISFLV